MRERPIGLDQGLLCSTICRVRKTVNRHVNRHPQGVGYKMVSIE